MRLIGKRKKNGEGRVVLSFEGDITIYTVKKLKEALDNELINSDIIELNLSNINKFDTAGFQLFLYANREAEKNNKTLSITEMNGEVSKIFSLFKNSI